jgi:bacterioferritin-associated ferredoxin
VEAKIRQVVAQALICVADVDMRLSCSTFCACCPYYVRERRQDQRRRQPRASDDRRILRRY